MPTSEGLPGGREPSCPVLARVPALPADPEGLHSLTSPSRTDKLGPREAAGLSRAQSWKSNPRVSTSPAFAEHPTVAPAKHRRLPAAFQSRLTTFPSFDKNS